MSVRLLSILSFHSLRSAGELLVKYHEYHSNFIRDLPERCIGFHDYDNEPTNVTYPDKYLGYRLCYSLHSSFSEIVDVLKTLKPRRVTPIAAPLTTLMTTKQLFQLIEHFTRDERAARPVPLTGTIAVMNEKIQRKAVSAQMQLKHRYESFETKLERKRRRRLFKERQQRRANDEELDFGLDDECEAGLLRRIHSLNESVNQRKSDNSTKSALRSTYHEFALVWPTRITERIRRRQGNAVDVFAICPMSFRGA